MTKEKPLLKILRGEKAPHVPFWFMRQAGRYLPEYRALRKNAGGFLDMVYTPDFAIEVTLQPVRRFPLDAAILFSDILVIPHALGQKVAFEDGLGPVLEPLDRAAPLKGLDVAGIHQTLGPVYKTVAAVRRELPDNVALIGFCGAPWTVATYMIEGGSSRDHAKTKGFAYKNPESFQALIDMLVEASVAYLLAQIEAGAEVVQIFDTWAGSLPETAQRRWCIAPVKKIVSRLRQVHADIPVIAFARGAGPLYMDYALETGVNCLGIDTPLSPHWAAENIQPLAAVQGNLDPRLVVVGGDAMKAEARVILQALKGGAHIFNLGHGIFPETPPEHVAELTELLRAWPGEAGDLTND